MSRWKMFAAAAGAVTALAVPASSASADASPPASCAGQDSSFLATALGGQGFSGLVTGLAQAGLLGPFTRAEAQAKTDCPA
jgi:hypothetical protein